MNTDVDESHGHEEVFDPAAYRPSKRDLRVAIVGILMLAAVLVVSGILPRAHRHAAAIEDESRRAQNPPRVIVTKPTRGHDGALSLPGSVIPFQETVVYARVNGYLRKYYVDIGDHVKKGDVIADIETPDLDQQWNQAKAEVSQGRASVEQTRAKLELARITNARYASLVPNKYVSQQLGDESKARFDVELSALKSAEAALVSAEAHAQHLGALKKFATLTAPLDGVVTSRTTEEGQLVSIGNASGQAIFKVARTDVMRMFVNVPQLYVPSIQTGVEATITVREFPNRVFKGKVSRTTRELDQATRTLITQIDVPNADDSLVAGMYAQALLPMDRSDAPLTVPSSAFVFNAEGTRVAVVKEGKIHWQPIRVDGDSGASLAVASGLVDTDDVVVMPSDKLVEGAVVKAEAVGGPDGRTPE